MAVGLVRPKSDVFKDEIKVRPIFSAYNSMLSVLVLWISHHANPAWKLPPPSLTHLHAPKFTNTHSTSSWSARPRRWSCLLSGSWTATRRVGCRSAGPPSGNLFLHAHIYVCVDRSTLGLLFLSRNKNDARTLTAVYHMHRVSTDGVIVRKVVGTPDGRIFLAGQDGNVYEVRFLRRIYMC